MLDYVLWYYVTGTISTLLILLFVQLWRREMVSGVTAMVAVLWVDQVIGLLNWEYTQVLLPKLSVFDMAVASLVTVVLWLLTAVAIVCIYTMVVRRHCPVRSQKGAE